MLSSVLLATELGQLLTVYKWYFFACGVLFVVCRGIVSLEMDRIAAMKGHPERKWFWYSFLFGFVGWIMIAMLPNKNANK